VVRDWGCEGEDGSVKSVCSSVCGSGIQKQGVSHSACCLPFANEFKI
jgi:hypothetical protein